MNYLISKEEKKFTNDNLVKSLECASEGAPDFVIGVKNKCLYKISFSDLINSSNVVVNTYAQMLALPARTYSYTVRVNTDTVNNGGNMSEYKIYPDGNIMWQASINVNTL